MMTIKAWSTERQIFLIYTDIFSIKHKDAKVINTKNDFNRIFVIEDKNGVRYTCLKQNAETPVKTKWAGKFKPLNPKLAPLNYLTPYFTGRRTK
ncbi:hypothetical protein [Lentilactobacillus hilgardii]|uniref:hypothetical protein n=1 Tax=Lentilactobacillus hilgardii TaxID=1588 RepID=UPI0021C438B4|nr:hypothetical protein [Lentilactobacillus hilgardii]